jgi:hypothetical protein
MTPLTEIGQKYENLSAAIGEQLFNQTAGLPFNTEQLGQLGGEMTTLCEEFLATYKEPRLMYLAALGSLAQATRLPIRLKLVSERLRIITAPQHTFKSRPVTWASWRQFNAVTDDTKSRQVVFDLFVEKAPQLASLIQRGFDATRDVYSKYDYSPLESYLEMEDFSYENLTTFISRLGNGARTSFLKTVEHYSQEMKQAPFDYFDDFYYFRGRIYQPLNKHLKDFNPLVEVRKLLRGLGFAAERIKVDNEDRPKKSPSAFCFGIRIPDDVRVVYKSVSAGSDMGSVFHEFGHGIHGISANPQDPPWKRLVVSRSVAETFSILIQSLLDNQIFLEEDLGLDKEAVRDIIDRRNFMELYFSVFYSSNSLMKLAYWKEGLTLAQASERWQSYTKSFYTKIPGDYWLLHHVMPNYSIYSPSYQIAAVRVANLEHKLAQEYGDRWWREPRAGTYIAELAATRGEFPVKEFSLDPSVYLRKIQQISFL